MPESAPLKARLRQLLTVPARWVPQVRQGVMVDFRQEAGDERPSLWITDARGERRIVASTSLGDPTAAIAAYSLSPDGTVLAWGTARGGADWLTVRFRDTRTGADLPDVLTGIKWPRFGWLGGDALAYPAFADPGAGEDLLSLNLAPRIKLHRFGTAQTDDEVIHESAGADWALPHVSRDGRWLVVQEQIGVVPARLLVRPVGSDEPWQTVVDGNGPIHFLGMVGDELICHDLRETVNGRVVADYFEEAGLPFVVALNGFGGTHFHGEAEVREALTISPHIPVVRTDARSRDSVKSTLITLVEHVLTLQV